MHQKTDLERQLGRLVAYATQNNLHVIETVAEVGSGMNRSRTKLLKVLGDPKVDLIIVEHHDRLTRFGAEYIGAPLAASNRKLVVIENSELDKDLVRDITEVLTSFCARLYGKRSAANRAKSALAAAQQINA